MIYIQKLGLNIVDTDEFLEMPRSARLLFYELSVRSVKGNIKSPRKIVTMTGASLEDLKHLERKGYAMDMNSSMNKLKGGEIFYKEGEE